VRKRLDGVNVEETDDRGEVDGAASRPIEKSVHSQASQWGVCKVFSISCIVVSTL